MTSADVRNGRFNWLALLMAALSVAGIVYVAGSDIATLKATDAATARELDGIADRLDRIEDKLDALIRDRRAENVAPRR